MATLDPEYDECVVPTERNPEAELGTSEAYFFCGKKVVGSRDGYRMCKQHFDQFNPEIRRLKKAPDEDSARLKKFDRQRDKEKRGRK